MSKGFKIVLSGLLAFAEEFLIAWWLKNFINSPQGWGYFYQMCKEDLGGCSRWVVDGVPISACPLAFRQVCSPSPAKLIILFIVLVAFFVLNWLIIKKLAKSK